MRIGFFSSDSQRRARYQGEQIISLRNRQPDSVKPALHLLGLCEAKSRVLVIAGYLVESDRVFSGFLPRHSIDISWRMGPGLCFLKCNTDKLDTYYIYRDTTRSGTYSYG